MTQRPRFTVVVSHPIQYYTPFYRALAAKSGMEVHAIFASRIGLENMLDPDMGVEMAWNMDLLGGYSHEFLPEADAIKDTQFRSVNNPSVWAALDRNKPDIVLLHGYNQLTSLRTLIWCGRHRVPALMIADSSSHDNTPIWARRAKRLVLPHLLSQFRAFLTTGDANERYYASFGVGRERMFRTPIMLDEAFWEHRRNRAAERARWRSTLGLQENDLAILFVGKLVPRKRPHDLLAAIEKLGRRGSLARQPRLLFAGNGVLLEELKAIAAAQCLPATFLGFVNVDELPGIYCAVDVLAHPAEREPYGVILIEAAVMGLPLVLSDRIGGIGPASIARPNENALIYTCGDVEGLAAALARLASEPETLSRFSTASLAISEDHDGHKSVAAAVAAVNYCLNREARMLSKHASLAL